MQRNKQMATFHNKGWQYFEKLNEIMPNLSVRGSHAFSAMNTAPPGVPEDDDAEVVAAGAAGSSGQDSHTNNDAMEVDRDGDASNLISTSTLISKRKFTSDDDATTFNSESGGLPANTSTNSFPSSTTGLEPVRKKSAKSTSSVSTSFKLQPKGPPLVALKH
jgi:hypothetical protein